MYEHIRNLEELWSQKQREFCDRHSQGFSDWVDGELNNMLFDTGFVPEKLIFGNGICVFMVRPHEDFEVDKSRPALQWEAAFTDEDGYVDYDMPGFTEMDHFLSTLVDVVEYNDSVPLYYIGKYSE